MPPLSSRSRSLALLGVTFVLGAAAIGASLAHDADGITDLRATRLKEPTPTRLVVFLVDSLSQRDVERPGTFPGLAPQLRRGLHGPVTPCTDAVTVPCWRAMSTGRDQLSFLSLVENFGGAGGIPEGSIFERLRADGRRVGYVGDPDAASAFEGFDWVVIHRHADDEATVREGMAALASEDLDVVVIHLREIDHAAHRGGEDQDAYRSALTRTDDAITGALALLRPTDHAVILGDHGHTPDGRHAAGLEVPTYASYLGPRFAREAERPMRITDHASIWMRLFGYRFGPESYVDDYFAGRPLRDAPIALIHTPTFDRSSLGGVFLLVMIAAAILAASDPPLVRAPGRWRIAFATLLVAILAGATFPLYRPLIYARGTAAYVVLALVSAASVRFVSRSIDRRSVASLPAETFVVALPTIYRFGGYTIAAMGYFLHVAREVVRAIRSRRPGRMLWALLGLGSFASVSRVGVSNFAIRDYVFDYLPAGCTQAVVAMGIVAANFLIATRHQRTRLEVVAIVVGLGFAIVAPSLPPRTFILPSVLLPLLALVSLRTTRAEPLFLALAPATFAYFLDFDLHRLLPLAASGLSMVASAHLVRRHPPLVRAAVVLLHIWLGPLATMGGRISGLDFEYFFGWLPEGARVEDSVVANVAITLGLVVTSSFAGLVVARRAEPELFAWIDHDAANLLVGKLVLSLAFLLGFVHRTVDVGPSLVLDVVSEVAMVLVLMGVAIAVLAALPRAETTSPG